MRLCPGALANLEGDSLGLMRGLVERGRGAAHSEVQGRGGKLVPKGGSATIQREEKGELIGDATGVQN